MNESLTARCARLEGKLAAREEEIERLRVDNAALVRDLLELKREGFLPPPAQPQRVIDQGPPLPPEILRAAEAIAKPGEALYDAIVEDARKTLAEAGDKELDLEVLAAEIREGSTLNPMWL